MAKPGPEARLVKKMKDAGRDVYGSRLVVVKQHGNEFTEVGVSDFLCCLDGVFVAAEVKAPESYGNNAERAMLEGPTVKQRLFIKRVYEAGGVAGVVVTVDQFLSLLRRAERLAKRKM